MNSGLYPWANAMVGPIRIFRVVTDLTLKTCAPHNWLNVDAVPDVCAKPRLDPFEFHGRRRSIATPQNADTANASPTRETNQPHRRV